MMSHSPTLTKGRMRCKARYSTTVCYLLFLLLIVPAAADDGSKLDEQQQQDKGFINGTMTQAVRNLRAGKQAKTYTMPSEEEEHGATWLSWPHNYGWDRRHIERYEPAWIDMTRALHTGERVRIIAYNMQQTRRIQNVLRNENIDMSKIDFYQIKTDDVWVRDNGPIFAFDDRTGKLVAQNWRFNGWGRKADWRLDNRVPNLIAKKSRQVPNKAIAVRMVNEGGSFEVDGHGTFLAKKSSILNNNRNPRMTQAQAERIFRQYLGVTNFIWLPGTKGLEITDDHIDGTARFADDGKVIVTHKRSDHTKPEEYDILVNAKNAKGEPYRIVILPLTNAVVPGTDFKGIYVNYYVGNKVVLMPWYNDPADSRAKAILARLYPNHRIAGIFSNELWQDGGQAHCVTQQEPKQRR